MHVSAIRRFVSRFLTASSAAALVALLATPAAAASPISRVSGSDRIATSVAVARSGWDQAEHVLLATSEDYPDAVAAAALAADEDAPVLLTPPDELHERVERTLERLGARQVTVLGGGGAISSQVVQRLRAKGLLVTRVAGPDRFATARDIAERVAGVDGAPVVAVALGTRADGGDAWPDALTAASLAGATEPVPTLLTTTTELPDATREAIEDLDPERVIVLGGHHAVSAEVVAQIREVGPAVTRLQGATRYATAVEVAEAVINREAESSSARTQADIPPPESAVFVSGEDFVDALSAGAFAAHDGAPLMLVPSGILDDGIDAFLRDGSTPIEGGVVVGGPAAVSDHVEKELHAAVTGETRPAPPPPPAPECPPNSAPDCAYTYQHAIETWERLAQCESGGNWAINTGSGYYGGLQFALSSWQAVGGQGYPHQSSKWEQIHRGELLHDRQGWGAWPACSQKLGLR